MVRLLPIVLVMSMLAAAGAAAPQIATDRPARAQLHVCVLPFGEVEPTQQRFEQLFDPVRTIRDARELGECQLVVMPSDWFKHGDAYDAQMRGAVEAWVKRGGALLVFQPNPFPRDDASITLFGTRVHVKTWYDKADRAVKIDAHHPIVANVDETELSYPADQIVDYERDRWTAIVQGSSTQSVSLLVGSFGKGRVAIDADNPARVPQQLAPAVRHTDAFVRAVVRWLVEGGRSQQRAR